MAPGDRDGRIEVDPDASPERYVAGDEALLERPPPRGRVAVLRARCLSYGVGIRSTAPYLARSAAEGIPAIRRSTGGAGLLHEPGDLAWTVVLPREDRRVGRDFVRAYGRLGRGVVRWLGTLGAAARWEDPPALSHAYCELSERGSILTSGGWIIGGAAQHAAGGLLLHHGTISRCVDRPTIERLFDLGEAASRRLGGLVDLGIDGPAGGLARDLAAALDDDLALD